MESVLSALISLPPLPALPALCQPCQHCLHQRLAVWTGLKRPLRAVRSGPRNAGPWPAHHLPAPFGRLLPGAPEIRTSGQARPGERSLATRGAGLWLGGEGSICFQPIVNRALG